MRDPDVQPGEDYFLDATEINFQMPCAYCGADTVVDGETFTHEDMDEARECWTRRFGSIKDPLP